MRPQDLIRFTVLLVFVDLALVLGYLRIPFFVLLGVFFLESMPAQIIILLMAIGMLVVGVFLLRRRKVIFTFSKWFVVLIALNSLINLIAAIFINADMGGFLKRIFGEPVLSGFLITQVFIIVINLWLYAMIKLSRSLLE